MGNNLILVGQIDALVIVQVSTAYLLVVEGEEFVKQVGAGPTGLGKSHE